MTMASNVRRQIRSIRPRSTSRPPRPPTTRKRARTTSPATCSNPPTPVPPGSELAPQEWGAPVVSLAVDPRDPAIVWAVQARGSASETSVFHRSTDGGNTWEIVEFAGLGPGTDRLLFDPHLPDTLYALSEPPHGDWAFLRSTDAGRTWEDIGESIRAEGPVFFVPNRAPGGTLYAATSRGLFKWVPESR